MNRTDLMGPTAPPSEPLDWVLVRNDGIFRVSTPITKREARALINAGVAAEGTIIGGARPAEAKR